MRAIYLQVLFAICHDKEPLAEVEKEAGKAISVTTTAAGGVTWETVDDSELTAKDGAEKKPRRKLSITIPKWCGKWVVGMDGFADGVVGAKSKNLAGECPSCRYGWSKKGFHDGTYCSWVAAVLLTLQASEVSCRTASICRHP